MRGAYPAQRTARESKSCGAERMIHLCWAKWSEGRVSLADSAGTPSHPRRRRPRPRGFIRLFDHFDRGLADFFAGIGIDVGGLAAPTAAFGNGQLLAIDWLEQTPGRLDIAGQYIVSKNEHHCPGQQFLSFNLRFAHSLAARTLFGCPRYSLAISLELLAQLLDVIDARYLFAQFDHVGICQTFEQSANLLASCSFISLCFH